MSYMRYEFDSPYSQCPDCRCGLKLMEAGPIDGSDDLTMDVNQCKTDWEKRDLYIEIDKRTVHLKCPNVRGIELYTVFRAP